MQAAVFRPDVNLLFIIHQGAAVIDSGAESVDEGNRPRTVD